MNRVAQYVGGSIAPWVFILAFTSFAEASDPPVFAIHRVGLFDAAHTDPQSGSQTTSILSHHQSGNLIGYSDRETPGGGTSAWWYRNGVNVRIGLFDAEHTHMSGDQTSRPVQVNSAGDVIGWSTHWVPQTNFSNISAWISREGVTHRLGYLDAEHTNSNGLRESTAIVLSESGLAAGYSKRYVGNSRTAWVWEAGVTHRLGFFGPTHTAADGSQYSDVKLGSANGTIAGTSERYDIGAIDAWAWRAGQLTQIGLTEGVHVSGSGFRSSDPRSISRTGIIGGVSTRYSGSMTNGQSAWVNDGTQTIQLGLLDSQHFNSSGRHSSRIYAINDDGVVAGYSDRYIGSSSKSAWLALGGVTHRIGLFDSDHTESGGRQSSGLEGLSQSGYAIGTSERRQGGRSAWRSNGLNTLQMGLYDASHTSATGAKESQPQLVNNNGDVVGESLTYPASIIGRSTWVHSDSLGETRRIGLYDGQYTHPDGHHRSTAIALNSSGDVLGFSERYVPVAGSGIIIGTGGWFYDLQTDTQIPLEFGSLASGRINVMPVALTEDSFVFGYFFDHTIPGNNLTTAFLWSQSTGMQPLDDLIAGGIGLAGWETLLGANGVNGLFGSFGVSGAGLLSGQTSNVNAPRYFLQQIPAPGVLPLMAIALIAHPRRTRARVKRGLSRA